MMSPFVRALARIFLAVSILTAVPSDSLALDFVYPDPGGLAPLDGPGGTSLTGTHIIAIPAEAARITPAGGTEVIIANCGTLLAANPSGGTNIPNITRFARFDRATDAFVNCVCPGVECFSLVPGEAYLLQITAASAFKIVGSHAYTMIPLLGAGPGSLTGTNFVSLPWTTSLATANQLQQSAGFANTTSVAKYLTATDSFQVYTGRKGGGLAFALVDTMGYEVRVLSTKYWAAPDPAVTTCDSITGDFPAGSDAEAMAAAFTAAWAVKVAAAIAPSPFVDYTCADLATPAGKVMVTKSTALTPCLPPPVNFGIVFTVPGGTTTALHPFGYQLCCSSPLAQSIAVDGARAVSLDNTTRVFSEFAVTSASEDVTPVPALNAAWMIALVAGLVAAGIWLRTR